MLIKEDEKKRIYIKIYVYIGRTVGRSPEDEDDDNKERERENVFFFIVSPLFSLYYCGAAIHCTYKKDPGQSQPFLSN